MVERLGKQKNTQEMANKLSIRTKFSNEECRSLLYMHQRISALGKVDRLRFREVLHTAFDITDDVMLDRVYRVFDKNNDGLVDEMEWVEGVSTMTRGTPDEIIHFCYTVYDINGDKSLAREELFHCLKGSLVPYGGAIHVDDVEEGVREIVEICMKKLDKDKDGQITQPDFGNACYEDPLLIQCIGPCLPPSSSLAAFLATFTENYRNHISEYDEWKRAVALKSGPKKSNRDLRKKSYLRFNTTKRRH